MNTYDPIDTIEKETITELQFPDQEVLQLPEDINRRLFDAARGTKLGNFYKDKVKIVFEDSVGIKMVETTIWGLTDKTIILKRGIVLPLNRIHEIII